MSVVSRIMLPLFVQGDPNIETAEGMADLPAPMGMYSVRADGVVVALFPIEQARKMALALLAGCIRAEDAQSGGTQCE